MGEEGGTEEKNTLSVRDKHTLHKYRLVEFSKRKQYEDVGYKMSMTFLKLTFLKHLV